MKNKTLDEWNLAQFQMLTQLEAKFVTLGHHDQAKGHSVRQELIRLDIDAFVSANDHADAKFTVCFHREIYHRLVFNNRYIATIVTRKVSRDLGSKTIVADVQTAAMLGLIYAIERFDLSKRADFGGFAYVVTKQRVWDDMHRPGSVLDARYAVASGDFNQLVDDARFGYEWKLEDAANEGLAILDALPEEERRIVELRLGLGGEDEDGKTLVETADCLGVSHETVRRKEKRALMELRNMLLEDG